MIGVAGLDGCEAVVLAYTTQLADDAGDAEAAGEKAGPGARRIGRGVCGLTRAEGMGAAGRSGREGMVRIGRACGIALAGGEGEATRRGEVDGKTSAGGRAKDATKC